MELEQLLGSLPQGKQDKPFLFGIFPNTYTPDDIDGTYYMIERVFSGCFLQIFSKPIDPEIRGFVSVDNMPLPRYVLKTMGLLGGMWVIGIPLRGYVTVPGKTYTVHVEGFTDTDGNEMLPQDIRVLCEENNAPLPEYAEHEAVALRAASEGIVLLKNENQALPLTQGSPLNLFGKGIHQFRTSAVGAGKINPRYTVNLLNAIRSTGAFRINEALVEFYRCNEDLIPPEELLRSAKGQSGTAVMMLTRGSGENQDNSSAPGDFYLTRQEEALIRTLAERFTQVIVILNVGYPMDVSFAEKYGVDALVYCGFGGMLGGLALCNILSGKENPSGKLPDTWAKDYYDIPASRNFYDCANKPRLDGDAPAYVDTVYEEGIYVGYRYFHTFHVEPAYSFGHGLSYTSFRVTGSNIRMEEALHLDIEVTNTGALPGKEVPQVYIRKPSSLLETPERELVWFDKTALLSPKESQTFHVEVSPRELSVYDSSREAYVMPEGCYEVFIGNSANAAKAGSFIIQESRIVKQVTHLMLAPNPPRELSRNDPDSFPTGSKSGVKHENELLPRAVRRSYPASFTTPKGTGLIQYEDLKADPDLVEAFVAQLSIEELARLSVCASSGWGMEGTGEAGRIYQVGSYGLPDFPVSDGNSGVNLRIKNIGMPSGATMAASFSKDLMQQIGRVIGEEAKDLGIPLILAPGLNLHRNPLNGRQPEYFSEDPYLAGTLAGYYCRGMESAGVGSCIKHLIANNCESSRKRNQSIIGERALRELYLKVFEIAMAVHMPASVMTAYNAVNGCYTSADEELIQGFLREENHFDGFVMTDWTSYDTADIAQMVEAGNCWITPGSQDDTYVTPILEGIANGTIRITRLQENAAYLIRTMLRFR